MSAQSIVRSPSIQLIGDVPEWCFFTPQGYRDAVNGIFPDPAKEHTAFSNIDLDQMQKAGSRLLCTTNHFNSSSHNNLITTYIYIDPDCEFVPFFNVLRYYTNILKFKTSYYRDTYKNAVSTWSDLNHSMYHKRNYHTQVGIKNTKVGQRILSFIEGLFGFNFSFSNVPHIQNQIIKPLEEDKIFAGFFVKKEDLEYIRTLAYEERKVDFSKIFFMYNPEAIKFSSLFKTAFNIHVIGKALEKRIPIYKESDFSFLVPPNSISPDSYMEAVKRPERTLNGFYKFIEDEF